MGVLKLTGFKREDQNKSSVFHYAVLLAVIAFLYFLFARLGLLLAFKNSNATPVWPPSGLSFAFILFYGRRVWPGIFIGALFANIAVFESNGFLLSYAIPASLIIAGGNTLEAVSGHYIFKWLSQSTNPFDNSINLFRFIEVIPVMCAISATVGAMTVTSFNFADPNLFGTIWFTWWLGDMAGIVIATPLVYSWIQRKNLIFTTWKLVESFIAYGMVIFVSLCIFAGFFPTLKFYDKPYIMLPVLLFAVFRLKFKEVTVCLTLMTIVAVWATINHIGPFALGTINHSLVQLLSYVCVISITIMSIAVTLRERRHSQRELEDAHDVLEQMLEERTKELVEKEKALKDSEETYRMVVESLNEGVLIYNKEGITTFINSSFSQIFGYRSEELLGSKTYKLITKPYQWAQVELRMKDRLAGRSGSYTMEMFNKNNERLIINIASSPYCNSKGEIIGGLLVANDVTAKRKAEEEIKNKTKLLQEAQHLAKIGSWEWDLLSGKRYASEEFFSIIGFKNPEMDFSPEDFFALVLDEDRDELVRHYQNLLIANYSYDIVLRIKTPNGSLKYLNSKAQSISEEGRVVKVKGIIQDITDKKITEDELNQKATQLENAQRVAHIGSWEWDINANKIAWSEELFRIFEVQAQDFDTSYENYLQLLHPDDKNFVDNLVKEAYAKPGSYNFFHRILTKNGRTKVVKSTLEVITDKANKPVKMFGTALDVTDVKKAEEEMRRAKELAEQSAATKQEFLANMSHEIRTPMNAILGFAGLMKNKELTSELREEYLSAIIYSGENLMELINQVLDYSRIESGKVAVEEIPVKLDNLIWSTLSIVKERADAKNVTLKYFPGDGIPEYVKGDSVKLKQILINLIANAVKFSEKGEVKIESKLITAEKDKITLQFAIKDQGIGIAKDKLGKIFESFTQASSGITRKYGGSGLGLSIVKQLVEILNGTISVDSEEGKGSVFTVQIPFLTVNTNETMEPEAGLANVFSTDELLLPGETYFVLVVEDNPINQLLATKVLHTWNFEVDVAENGKKALEKLNEKKYDIVLMDVQMPEMDGYEATRNIRTGKYCDPHIPVIAMTAHAVKGEKDKCLQAGMDNYISKPFNPGELYSLISSYLKRKMNTQIDPTEFPEAPVELEKIIDISYLKSVVGDDKETIDQMLGLFLEKIPDTLKELNQWCDSKNWKRVKAIAHSMKSSLSIVGMKQAVKWLEEIEEYSGNETNLDKAGELIVLVNGQCQVAIKEIKETKG